MECGKKKAMTKEITRRNQGSVLPWTLVRGFYLKARVENKHCSLTENRERAILQFMQTFGFDDLCCSAQLRI